MGWLTQVRPCGSGSVALTSCAPRMWGVAARRLMPAMTEHRDYVEDGMADAGQNVWERQRSAYFVRASDLG